MLVAAQRAKVAGLVLFASMVCGLGGGPPADQGRGDGDGVSEVLDRLHRYASEANGAEYFALFAEDAVFLGTDATERWTIGEFRAYAEPHFVAGRGWTYTLVPGSRNVTLGPGGEGGSNVAWFDERLVNAKYGECRGTGVLVKVGKRWRIAQYNLTVPIPNALLERVAGMIRDGGGAGE